MDLTNSDCDCANKFKNYLIRVKYQTKIRLVRIPKNELNITVFLDKAFKELQIDAKEELKIQLLDNLSTPIPADLFEEVVQSFWKGGSFFINLVTEIALDAAKSMVTPEILEKYLIDKNAGFIFVEQKTLGPSEKFSVKTRRQLVNHLVDFMRNVYGKQIKTDHKIAVAKAAIILFPCMKIENSDIGGIDLLYNPTNGGFMSNRLKNVNTAEKKKSIGEYAGSSAESSAESCDEVNEDENSTDDSAVKECFEDLKYMMVNDQNRPEIEIKLRRSREYRAELLKIGETDVLESFPYFFVDPKLILFEFSDTFTEVNANAYLDIWPTYAQKLENLLRTQYASSNFHTQWTKDIHNVFILLKLLPPRFGPKPAAGRETFNDSIDKLIVFSPLGTAPKGMMVHTNNHPYIIAYGSSKTDISKFYIEIEKNLMSMPDGFGFLETFDLFYKIHKVFNLNFEVNLKNMFCFIQNYIYKQTDKDLKPTPQMIEIFSKLS